MNDLIHVSVTIPHDKVGPFYAAVAALFGAASTGAIAASLPAGAHSNGTPQPVTELKSSPTPSTGSTGNAPAADAPSGGAGAGDASGELDAEGWPWSADMHASTKNKTKAGLWRMKVGVTRPDPKPGFAKAGGSDDSSDAGSTDTTTSANGAASGAGASASTPPAVEDDDEFAAFRAAAADTAPAVEVKARTYTDADLGALCNQAATKLGDPTPVKAIIAEFMPEGTVPHSRNVPAERRADFVKAVEAKAGIEFAG